MNHFAPPQRDVAARILTSSGWMRGNFVVPQMRRFVEFANHPDDFFKLRDVQLPSIPGRAEFFALQRDSVVFIIPDSIREVSRISTLGQDKVERDVSCAFDNGLISGSLYVPKGLRVSDYLIQRKRFFEIYECEYVVGMRERIEKSPNLPIALVNANRIIGVSEPRVR